MGFIAIAGCGALGGALAHKLAGRDRVAEIRLIDPEGRIAQGKALDILQSSPVEQFSTRITSADAWTAAAGADVVVVADDGASSQELSGESGLAILRQIADVAGSAPILFAGAAQRELMARTSVELKVPRRRLLGSAPLALESAMRAMAGVLLDGSGVDVMLRIVGVPPNAAVVAWEEAAAFGLPLSSQLAAHQIAMLNSKIRGLGRPARTPLLPPHPEWPKGCSAVRDGGSPASCRSNAVLYGSCCRDAGGIGTGGCEAGAGAVADTTGADAARERVRNVRALEWRAFPPPRARTQARYGETSP